MSTLDRWHEIHDAYVTFFGDDHRPAAVECADRAGRGLGDARFGPGAIIPVKPGGRVEYLAPPLANYSQVFSHRYDLERVLLYGEK